LNAAAQTQDAQERRGVPGRPALLVAAGILLLAVVEAASALLSPLRTPSDADWSAAAAWVKSGHRPGDLIVATPDWADQVLRLHLGDLIPPRMAGRLDHRAYGRIWVLAQRGARAEEGFESDGDSRLRDQRRFGQLRARLYERPALVPTYDFVESWDKARVARVETGGKAVPCALNPDQHQCPDLSFNFVKPRVLEIGNALRRALLVQPVANAAVVLEYTQVPMGKELAVGAGLHNVWRRKGGDGTVRIRALVDGQEVGRSESGNRTGWTVARFPTPAFAGKTATVRFEVTSERPFSRHFGFAAEARGK
jgi:hypothetical protein